MTEPLSASRVFATTHEKGWDTLTSAQKGLVERLRRGSLGRKEFAEMIPGDANHDSIMRSLRWRGFLVDYERGRYILSREPGVARWCPKCGQKLSQYNPYRICEACRLKEIDNA